MWKFYLSPPWLFLVFVILLNVFIEFCLFLNMFKMLNNSIKNELVTKCKICSLLFSQLYFTMDQVCSVPWVFLLLSLKSEVSASKRIYTWLKWGWCGEANAAWFPQSSLLGIMEYWSFFIKGKIWLSFASHSVDFTS